ncbi:Piwi-domain-containing protein [Hypomontagnella monticulosa]|nr:Piwi-domain-containing protein [Hypomontagnella monticulosa]
MSDKGSVRGSATSAGSRHGSQQGSRPGSPTRGSAKPSGFPKGMGFDPARQRPQLSAAELVGKRVDLPADAFKKGKDETRFAARPGYNNQGKAVKMQLNIFQVLSWTDADIYQYDVEVTPNLKKSDSLVKKVWNTETVNEALRAVGGMWLFDGSKLAWSSKSIDRGETRLTVDLDHLKGKAPHEDIAKKVAQKNSIYRMTIRQTTTIRLAYLKGYLQGRTAWDTHVLECMNFFDHCLRQFPTEKWVMIKRNFYDPLGQAGKLGEDLITNQGVYIAPRLSETINRGGTGLAINVDRCQTAFWPVDSFDQLALRILNGYGKPDWENADERAMERLMKPVPGRNKEGHSVWVASEAFQAIQKLVKLRFFVVHRGKIDKPKLYTCVGFTFYQEHGQDGSNAYTCEFDRISPDGTVTPITVYKHYVDRWDVRLRYPKLPLIKTRGGQLFPMELCNSAQHQRYTHKLNPIQTTDMIKMAATRPPKRKEDILEGTKYMEWDQDPYLKAFGIKINPNMLVTDARLLPNPQVSFSTNSVNPGVSGRWDLRGKKFIKTNTDSPEVPLTSWGFIGCGTEAASCKAGELERFANKFCQIYRNHGGSIGKAPYSAVLPWSVGDAGKICEKSWVLIKEHFGKLNPQLIFFVLPSKNSLVYERIKKNMDCRFNIVSQCLQATHVKKCQDQYISNVAMKVNSKLGGVTCQISHPDPKMAARPPFWVKPTMMIGVDVSHAAPGSEQPSMAALTVSLDKHATKYAAACQTNGWRRETVMPETMHFLLTRLAKHWGGLNQVAPAHVYYMRDGVSEGQFEDVIKTEVNEMRRIFREVGFGAPKFTVIVATKRHHVRFFPKPGDKTTGDRNGNPVPGILVERDVTHPQHFDFYLCSHVAIQGTARPVHYQVILDEAGVQPNDLTKMIYQQCYQYCRSTTPVSLHPAVYYAHLASNRARSHENIASKQKELGMGKSGHPVAKTSEEIYEEEHEMTAPPLLPMSNNVSTTEMIKFINTTMWYV